MAEISLNNLQTQINDKADKSEIPTSLPANGGNADTVGGLTSAQLISQSSGSSHGKKLFTSSGTFVVPQGVIELWLTLVAPGGGGGGMCGTREDYMYMGGFGGKGGVLINQNVVVTPGASIPVTIGNVGAAGANRIASSGTATAGGAGGTSSFGNLVSVLGGGGGGGATFNYADGILNGADGNIYAGMFLGVPTPSYNNTSGGVATSGYGCGGRPGYWGVQPTVGYQGFILVEW